MDTLVQIYQNGEWYVAVDLATNVADQGKTREEAITRLKIGLKEHYATLLEMLEKDKKFVYISHPLIKRSFNFQFLLHEPSYS